MANDCGLSFLYDDEADYEGSESSFSEHTPTRAPALHHARPPQDITPYRRPHPYFPPYDCVNSHSWFQQTDSKIQALVDSQKKMVVMFEKVSDRLSQIENAVSSNSARSSQSTSADEKFRVPPQLSVRVNVVGVCIHRNVSFSDNSWCYL